MIEETHISIHIPIEELLRRLNILNGFIQLLAHQLDVFQKTSEELYKEPDGSDSNVFAAFALAIPDLSTTTDQHFNYVHGGAYIKEGEEYFRAGEEFVRNWSAWTIAQSYEAFETFLRDTAAHFFYNFRPQKPIGSLQQIPIDIENIDAWKSCFRERKWEPLSILNLFRLTEPTIADLEKHNYLQLDLQQWFLLYTSVRHSVTHANSRLSRLDLKASVASIDKILPTFFPGVWSGDIYDISCSENNALSIIQLTGAYAFIIYKKLCSRGDIPLLIDIMK
jgi:hypothetical protein